MAGLRHLYNCRARVQRLSGIMAAGTPTITWSTVEDVLDPVLGEPGQLMCRLDLMFVRPGKDQPMPVVAGRAPDRVGLLFCDATNGLRAGDRLQMIAGPVVGTFEIRVTPDPALDLATAHHLEVQVIEVAQALVNVFPGATVQDLEPAP
jgi:hypothetical protein